MEIKPKSFKQFEVKAPKGLKGGVIYEIDYTAKGIPDNVIIIPISITLINQSVEMKQITQGQHTGMIHVIEGRTPLGKGEVQEVIHQLKVS